MPPVHPPGYATGKEMSTGMNNRINQLTMLKNSLTNKDVIQNVNGNGRHNSMCV